jgi:hypothetical protein
MIDQLENFIKNTLDKLNFLDSQGKVSLTNITVAIFVLIAAIRMLFGGSTLNIGSFAWNLQTINIADTLPVMFSLLNYGHKRSVNNNNNQSGSKDV